MAYEKQTWRKGEKITKEKLNHMENGISEAYNSGGGSSLPPVTSEDVGKVLTVDENGDWAAENSSSLTPSVSDVNKYLKAVPITNTTVVAEFIPEQTISGEHWILIPDSNQSVFVADTNISAVINGTTYTGVVDIQYDYPGCELYDSNGNESGFILDVYDGNTELNPPIPGTYTISASVVNSVVVGADIAWNEPISCTKNDIGKMYQATETFTPIEGAVIPLQEIHSYSYNYRNLTFDSEEQYLAVYNNFVDGNRVNAVINGYEYSAKIMGNYAYFNDGYVMYRNSSTQSICFSPTPTSNYYTVSAIIGTVGAKAEFSDYDFSIYTRWQSVDHDGQFIDEITYTDYSAEEIYHAIENNKNVHFNLMDSVWFDRYRTARLAYFDDTTPSSHGNNTGCLFNAYGVQQGTIRGYRFLTIPEYNSSNQQWTQTTVDVVFYNNPFGEGGGYYLVVNDCWDGRTTGENSEPIVI